MNAEEAAKIISEVGIFRLAGADGCLCMSCATNGIHVDVSCRKSSGGEHPKDSNFYGTTVRVYSHHLDATFLELEPIAALVVGQLERSGDGCPIRVRYCEYKDDAESRCAYCHAPRKEADGYLCERHLADEDVAPQYRTVRLGSE